MLCDLLHKLPSEIENEDEEKVIQLLIYFKAKNIHEQERREQMEMDAQNRRD